MKPLNLSLMNEDPLAGPFQLIRSTYEPPDSMTHESSWGSLQGNLL